MSQNELNHEEVRQEDRASLFDRLASKKLKVKLAIAKAFGQEDAMRDIHVAHWKKVGGNSYYDRVSVRFEQWFLGPHQPFVQAVESLARDRSFDRFVEIGCGDGQVLNAFAQKLTDIPKFIGMDVNEEIIARNSLVYRDEPRLSFVAEDFTKTYEDRVAESTLYLSYGGVLEYFSERDLTNIIETTAKADCAFCLVEPLDPDHDLIAQKESYSFGYEASFSHNHKALLETAGWTIRFDQEVLIAGIRFKMLIAEMTRTKG